MKFRLIFLMLFLVGFGKVYSQDKSKPKIKCEYLLYLPIDYSSSKESFPVIIYLHGLSHRGDDLNILKRYGLPNLIAKGRNFDFIIASPQCPISTSWWRVNWFDDLYRDLCIKYRIDKHRIYVMGMSMGGYGTWQVAMDYPDMFAAIVPLCGGCNDPANICRLKDLPIWAFHGSADSAVFVSETERLVTRLRKCDGNIKYTRLENEGHNIEHLFRNKPEIFEWMLEHRK